MTHFQNRAISASAGTGKTFRLAHRYLGLMAAGVPPDRICALTFSRKAAGEIFDKIVEHLCEAATDAGKRARTAATIAKEGLGAPPDQPAAYIHLLRKLLDHEHRLRIGTLDSFILGVVRAFPMELGISPETQPMNGDGGEALAVRQAILTRIFDPTRHPDMEGDREGGKFLSDFRLACSGQETKTLVAVLDNFIFKHYGFFRHHNKAAWHWGDPSCIWPSAERWWELPECNSTATHNNLPDGLSVVFGPGSRPEALGKACAVIAAAAMSHAADKTWPKLSEAVLSKLLALAVQNEPPVIKYYDKGYPIPSALWTPLRNALGNLLRVEVTRALTRTMGLRAVLNRYDQLYEESLSTGGCFTFEDISLLLGAGGLSPSRTPDAPDRLYIDYRLDGKLDHWLLDEFQDTSNTQWAALENLIDEVIQDDSRSFFYVGDVKQSVYGWRGGNHRLFGEVLKKYANPGPRAIVSEAIAECHRSLPAVIGAVNGVFDGLAGWVPAAGAEKGLRRGALEAFSGIWKKHTSARLDEGEGFAALLEYAPKKNSGDQPASGNQDGDDFTDDPAEFEAVAKVLEQVQPTLRCHTAAVLVRSNQAGRVCVDVLRRQLPAVPVVHEGQGGIVDNPVVALLLALVRYSAHPGDTVALRHLQMSPLIKQPELQDFDALPGVFLTAMQEYGFAGALREWGARLGILDAFGRQRLRELLAAAEQFDATGVRDTDAFADHIRAYQVKASAAAGTVRVMTIHQAKGLGFDLVIVPFDASDKSFDKPGDRELLAGDNWVLNPPCYQVLNAAAGQPLQALDAARADANFAQLCLLYVSLTRAQRALYMLIPAKSEKNQTVRAADLLRERLAPAGVASSPGSGGLTQIFAAGDCAWFKQPGKHIKPVVLATPAPLCMTHAVTVARREPSKDHSEDRAFPAQWLFKSESGDVRVFGSAIHRLFQKIEWIEDADIERVISGWRAEAAEPASLLDNVEQQFRLCLANADVRRQLSRPAGAARTEVWREAPFDLVLESEGIRHLMSGRFDRLVVERDAAGQPLRATVFDFKSNRVETVSDLHEAADGYAGQMAGYARAAARLLGLPPAQVAIVLLFTRTGWIWPHGDNLPEAVRR